MAASPMLPGSNFTLQPFSKNLISPTYISWLNNVELMRFSRQRHHIHTAESCLQFLQSFENSPHYFWAIIADGLGHVGNLTAIVDTFNSLADLTIMVGDPQARGTGIACAAWQTSMNFLLSDRGLRKVTAGTMSCNLAMIKIMQKSGMEPDGCRKRQFLFGTQEVDCVMYARFATAPKKNS